MINSLSEYNWSWSINSNFSLSTVSIDFAKSLLAGYQTCTDSELNGYQAYDELNSRYFSKMSEEVLNSPLEYDFDYDDYINNDRNYVGIERKETDITIGDKINALKSMYETGSLPSNAIKINFNDNSIFTLLGICFVASAIIVIVLVSKRRKTLTK